MGRFLKSCLKWSFTPPEWSLELLNLESAYIAQCSLWADAVSNPNIDYRN